MQVWMALQRIQSSIKSIDNASDPKYAARLYNNRLAVEENSTFLSSLDSEITAGELMLKNALKS